MSSQAESDAKPRDADTRAYHRARAVQERVRAERAGTDTARAIHTELAALHEAAGHA